MLSTMFGLALETGGPDSGAVIQWELVAALLFNAVDLNIKMTLSCECLTFGLACEPTVVLLQGTIESPTGSSLCCTDAARDHQVGDRA